MKQKEEAKFSLTGLFIITAICFFIFNWLIKLIDGTAAHSTLFVIIGFISIGLGILSFINDLTKKPAVEKKNDPIFLRSSEKE